MKGIIVGYDGLLGKGIPEVEIIHFRGVLGKDGLLHPCSFKGIASLERGQGARQQCQNREPQSSMCRVRRNN